MTCLGNNFNTFPNYVGSPLMTIFPCQGQDRTAQDIVIWKPKKVCWQLIASICLLFYKAGQDISLVFKYEYLPSVEFILDHKFHKIWEEWEEVQIFYNKNLIKRN